VAGAAVTGDDHGPAGGDLVVDLRGGRDAVAVRHLQVEDGHVRPVRPRRSNGRCTGGGCGDHVQVLLEAEQPGERVADERLVVSEEDLDHGRSMVAEPRAAAAGTGTTAAS